MTETSSIRTYGEPFQFHLKGKHNQKTHGGNAAHIPDVSDIVQTTTGHVGQATAFMVWQQKDFLQIPSQPGKKKWFQPHELKVVTKGGGIDLKGKPIAAPSSSVPTIAAPPSGFVPFASHQKTLTDLGFVKTSQIGTQIAFIHPNGTAAYLHSTAGTLSIKHVGTAEVTLTPTQITSGMVSGLSGILPSPTSTSAPSIPTFAPADSNHHHAAIAAGYKQVGDFAYTHPDGASIHLTQAGGARIFDKDGKNIMNIHPSVENPTPHFMVASQIQIPIAPAPSTPAVPISPPTPSAPAFVPTSSPSGGVYAAGATGPMAHAPSITPAQVSVATHALAGSTGDTLGKPDFATMTQVPSTHLEGMHSKDLFNDPVTGEQWMFKGDWASGISEIQGYKVAKLLGAVVPNGIQAVNWKGKQGSAQTMYKDIVGQVRLKELHDLNSKQIGEIQAHHVIDWLTAQHDTNNGALLIAADGSIRAIDKGQSFKFFGKDELDWKYHPNLNPTIHNTLGVQHIEGSRKLDRAPAIAMVAKVETLSDSAFVDAIRPVAKFHDSKGWMTEAKFIADALERKHTIRAAFNKYYDALDLAALSKDINMVIA